MRRASPLAIVLLVGCAAAPPVRAPLPPPAAERSWVPRLPSPAEGEPIALDPPALPPVVHVALPSGLTVEIVEQRATPIVYAALVARSPGPAEPELDALLERALAETLASGTEGTDSDVDPVRVHERGIVITSRVVPDELVRVLAEYASILHGVALTGDRIAPARVALLERLRFERARRARRGGYPSPEEDLFTRLYGEDHLRARRMRMRASRVERIDAARLRERLAELLSPSESALVIVGDVDAAAVAQTVRERFASLALAPAPRPARRRAPELPDTATRLRIHGIAARPSATVRLVEHGPALEHADHAAFRVLARLVGGMFSSALSLRLREARGDAYDVMTTVSAGFDSSVLDVTVVVPTAAAGSTASAIVEELARLSDAARIQPDELERARRVELAQLDAALETSTGLGNVLVAAFLARRPPSAIVDTFGRVATVDAEAVAAAARRWVRPERAPMVIVGDYHWLSAHPVQLAGGVAFISD